MISLELHHAAYSLVHLIAMDRATESHLVCLYSMNRICCKCSVTLFLRLISKVNSKTVAQCVEFYYTYKKQVKIGKNGTLIYGEAEFPETRPTEEEVDYKVSLHVCVSSLIRTDRRRGIGFLILSAVPNRVRRGLTYERKRKKTGSGRYRGTGSERAALTG